ncbi:hypothetical protein NECAME_08086 [Necator americanus]|uniref:Uncharacterized protein n=1 Tax=Necator americanus TaxID=51031 RepID=W2TMF7_NECAM|nr:hypothetical protein NECAME_08086 [Necator americanus]ETN82212.1 hypothetical protein NECAME_08086 [Necator americanus]
MYFANSDNAVFNETDLRKAIDRYDVNMSVKPAIHREKRWDLWGGLYYAGTIYTTIVIWKKNFRVICDPIKNLFRYRKRHDSQESNSKYRKVVNIFGHKRQSNH